MNETLFRSLPHARAVLETWRRDYNEERPHSKLGWMTPRDYARALSGDAGLLQHQPTKAQINPGLPLWLDEKRGSRHGLKV